MSHRITRVVTRTGDDGTTGLADGLRLPKSHSLVAALGDVDELNSAVGNCSELQKNFPLLFRVVQRKLFDLGAELALPGSAHVEQADVEQLDGCIASNNARLEPLTEFVLPRGPVHLARAVCRRAERSVWAANPRRREPAVYLNRLGDLLFVLARRLEPVELMWEGPPRG